MTRDEVVEWIRRYAAAVAEQKQYLTDLDAAIGDGDHGININRGMSEVCAKLDGLAERDIGAILNAVGMTLLSKVGGAAGPLYGTLFMRFSKETAGKLELTGTEFAAALEAGLTGIQQRGSAPGAKRRWSMPLHLQWMRCARRLTVAMICPWHCAQPHQQPAQALS